MRCERTARASFCFAVSNIVRGMATMTIVYGLVIMMLTMLGSNQVPPDFSGVWQLNLGESTILGSKPQWMLVKIERQGANLVQDMLVKHENAAEERIVFTYDMAGKETVNSLRGAPVRTRVHWEGSVLVIEAAMKVADREVRLRDHWSLSADGQTLTMAHPDDDLAGQVSVLEKAGPEAAAKFDKTEK